MNQTDEQFRDVIFEHNQGNWWIVEIEGKVNGIGVMYPDREVGTLHIFYLNGRGLWGNVKALARALMDISRRNGLRGLSVTTEDIRRVRLYAQSGAKIVHFDEETFTLEIENSDEY